MTINSALRKCQEIGVSPVDLASLQLEIYAFIAGNGSLTSEKLDSLPRKVSDYDPVFATAAHLYPPAMAECGHFIESFTTAGQPLPKPLALLAKDVLQGKVTRPKKRGKKKTNWFRDYCICRAIAGVRELFPEIKPTRNRESTDKESVCSVVTSALERQGEYLSEAAVEKIWQHRPK